MLFVHKKHKKIIVNIFFIEKHSYEVYLSWELLL